MTEPRGLTLDAGALIAFERREDRVRKLLHAAGGEDRRPVTVPAVALAQAWRGPRHRLAFNQLLLWAAIEPFTETRSRRTGELLARTATSDVVDAAVAVSAAERGDIVLTSDPEDLLLLAELLPAIRVLSV